MTVGPLLSQIEPHITPTVRSVPIPTYHDARRFIALNSFTCPSKRPSHTSSYRVASSMLTPLLSGVVTKACPMR